MINGYRPKLNLLDTERAIKLVKDNFERKLAAHLNLERVSAPRFLEVGNGLQDDLAGTQVPVSFHVRHTDRPMEIVHSLAKWKRMALQRYGFAPDTGLYTDMDAIRKDEDVSPIHSIYVDQWDWEKCITDDHRNMEYLRFTVSEIYRALIETESIVHESFPVLEPRLPREIHFVHSQELEDRWPDLEPKEREHRAAREYGAYFLIGIGAKLNSGQRHDLRAADYDDWSSPNDEGGIGLNGDIIVHDQTRDSALELSSMGIRVDAAALLRQLREMDLEDRQELEFQSGVLNGDIPLSIGGGIGQSRLCMLLLQKAHVGEVQVSTWPEEMVREYHRAGVEFL
ncbi:MAG TPA: aspartate--ammonia ligase [Sediminispirochaeta sp.]|nr:aspartate--ammonia ligase [Sediminispirochaeta sp.]